MIAPLEEPTKPKCSNADVWHKYKERMVAFTDMVASQRPEEAVDYLASLPLADLQGLRHACKAVKNVSVALDLAYAERLAGREL
jgi:hypothetical protein